MGKLHVRQRGYAEVGDDIFLVRMKDDCPPPGSPPTGTVVEVDDAGTVHVVWDEGRRSGRRTVMGLIPGVDEYVVFPCFPGQPRGDYDKVVDENSCEYDAMVMEQYGKSILLMSVRKEMHIYASAFCRFLRRCRCRGSMSMYKAFLIVKGLCGVGVHVAAVEKADEERSSKAKDRCMVVGELVACGEED
jgi:hypothetical protein